MPIQDRLAHVFGVKALGDARGSQPALHGAPGEQFLRQTEARQHGKAYGGGREGIDYFYDAANVIAQATSQAPIEFLDPKNGKVYLLDKRGTGDPETLYVQDEFPDLHELFRHPNPWMDWQEHIELAVIDLLAVGNAYWLKWSAGPTAGKPSALYRLAPQFIEIKQDEKNLIKEYWYGEGEDRIKIKPSEMVHFRLPNPLERHSVYGIGAIQAAPRAFDVELGLLEAQATYFERGAQPAAVVESDRAIPTASRRKSEREFRNLNSGSRRWFGVAFLERGMHYKPLSDNASEAGYKELSRLSRERIFAMLRVPPILAGFDTGGRMTLFEARQMFAEDVMTPFLSRLERRITWHLTSAWGLNTYFSAEYQMPAADRLEIAAGFAELPGIKIKEVRARAGLPPLGPEFKDEAGELIDEYVLNVPGPSTEGPFGQADNVGNGPGRPANPESTARFETAPRAGKQSDEVNGRPASNADRARRQRTAARVIRRRTGGYAGKALSAEDLAFVPPALLLGDKHVAAIGRAATQNGNGGDHGSGEG